MSHTRPIIAFAVPRFLIDPCEHECQERKKKENVRVFLRTMCDLTYAPADLQSLSSYYMKTKNVGST